MITHDYSFWASQKANFSFTYLLFNHSNPFSLSEQRIS